MLSTQAPKSNKSIHSAQVTQSTKPINQQTQAATKPAQPTHMQTINVVNISKNEDNSLIVEHDKDNHKFIIKDHNNILGHFTIGQIFKYINSDIEGFLINVDLGISVELIEKYLIKHDGDEINLISHLSSPITGNIELLVKLYKDIQSFEPTLQVEYEHLNELTKNNVRLRNKNFIYNILTHIIKLFATYTSTNKKLSDDTKTMIMSYSIGAVYRLNTMIKEDLEFNLQKITTLYGDLNNLRQIRQNMIEQMAKLDSSIKIQNDKIDLLITNIQQKGGSYDTTTNYSTTNTGSSYTGSSYTGNSTVTGNTTSNTGSTTITSNKYTSITKTPETSETSESQSNSDSDSDSDLSISGDNVTNNSIKKSKKQLSDTSYTNTSNTNSTNVSKRISSFLTSSN
jgi:hypothetical protein